MWVLFEIRCTARLIRTQDSGLRIDPSLKQVSEDCISIACLLSDHSFAASLGHLPKPVFFVWSAYVIALAKALQYLALSSALQSLYSEAPCL